MHARALASLLIPASLGAVGARHERLSFQSQSGRIAIEAWIPRAAPARGAAVILLYGSGAEQASGMPYARLAEAFVSSRRSVYLPHYLDATKGSASRPERHYGIWSGTVRDALGFVKSSAGISTDRIAIVGYSLGASVALCTAAIAPDLAGVVDWSGSMPDGCRWAQRLPPLLMIHGARDSVIPPYNVRQLAALCELRGFSCETRIFPGEGHRFSAGGLARADQDIETFLDRTLGSP